MKKIVFFKYVYTSVVTVWIEYSLIFNMIEAFKKTGSSEFIIMIWEL